MNNIFLIRLRGKEDLPNSFADLCEPLGTGYLTAVLRKAGYTVFSLDEILDGITREQMLTIIKKSVPRLAGLSVCSQQMWPLCESFAYELKKNFPQMHLTVGGHLPTARPFEVLKTCPAIDSVIIGEGEITIVELADALFKDGKLDNIKGLCYKKGETTIMNSYRPAIKNLDDLPFVSRDHLPNLLKTAPVANIIASRGCIGSCDYCSMNAFYKKNSCNLARYRSAKSVCEEIEILVNRYNVRYLQFHDDSFIGPGKNDLRRIIAISDFIKKLPVKIHYSIICRPDCINADLFSSLVESGLNEVFMGIESTDMTFYARHGKNCTDSTVYKTIDILGKLNIHILLGFIMFEPSSRLADIRQNIEFLSGIADYDIDVESYLNGILPMTGTIIEQEMTSKSLLTGNFWNLKYIIQDKQACLFQKLAASTAGKWINFDNLDRYSIPAYKARFFANEAPAELIYQKKKFRDSILQFLTDLANEVESIQIDDVENNFLKHFDFYSHKADQHFMPYASMLRLKRSQFIKNMLSKENITCD